VRKFLKRYLHWVQNSVFEGELTKSEINKVKNKLKKLTKPSEDNIKLYIIRSEKFIKREEIGTPPKEKSNIL